MNITKIIEQNNLYPNNIKVYSQPFSSGSQFFWNKTPSSVEFINDVNKQLEKFFHSLRQGIQLDENSIYFKHEPYTQNIDEIRNSNFFKRLQLTYLVSRTYERVISMSDSKQTFFLCLTIPDEQIMDKFTKIQGKFLFIFPQKNFKLYYNNLKILQLNEATCIYNYKIQNKDFLF